MTTATSPSTITRSRAATARFELDIDGYLASDLESTNGTFVNDTPAKQTLLADGDYLRVGNCLYRFLAGGNVEADYHEELYRLAILDALTGLYNKRYLMDYLQREIDRSARHNRPLAVILFDIDHFKSINDTMGHLAGDLTLRELARSLRSEICKDDLLARYGGEEFAAVLTETDQAAAAELAERLRRTVAGPRVYLRGSSLRGNDQPGGNLGAGERAGTPAGADPAGRRPALPGQARGPQSRGLLNGPYFGCGLSGTGGFPVAGSALSPPPVPCFLRTVPARRAGDAGSLGSPLGFLAASRARFVNAASDSPISFLIRISYDALASSRSA